MVYHENMNLDELLSRRAKVYFIGIKGTGVCALAELFHHSGLCVSGSDSAEVFYTDAILKELGIPYYEHFDAAHVPPDAALAIHSAAYNAEENPEMAQALRLGIPLLKYTDALGAYSALFDSSGIAGVHGKTTTTALTGVLFRAAGLPARVLAGSAVSAFGGRSTLSLGDTYFAAETCEYRRHFLAFNPRRIVLTSVESDHQDYFPAYDDIRDAFVEYALKLPSRGELVYCADDPGACEVKKLVMQKRDDLTAVPYGFGVQEESLKEFSDNNFHGDFRISSYEVRHERTFFRLACFPDAVFKLRIPGRHCVLDAAAALALTGILVKKEYGQGGWTAERLQKAVDALEGFTGSRRRSELLGEKGGVLFMDDYGHHPRAIRSTLQGLREFYPGRRIIVSFMSHTYTRTAALLDDFAASLLPADMVFLHKIYASAREAYSGGVNGQTLFEKTKAVFEKEGYTGRVFYTEEPEDAAEQLQAILREGDLFITMGAGNNWPLGKKLYSS
ncbi:MAG: UDP-N-acetylmuramate--L-alanine ligase [Spirochaetaceae bacterium]|nr:UDP-N-acetylmuramate--L-alanine ligase [Spirochaetaceae bacterium]